MPHDKTLLIAALSALVGCPVVTYEDYVQSRDQDVDLLAEGSKVKYLRTLKAPAREKFMPLDMEAFHKSILIAPAPQPLKQSWLSGLGSSQLVPTGPVTIFVKTLSGRTITVTARLSDKVGTIKDEIAEKADVPPEDQRLVYAGKNLEDGLTLHDYGIMAESTIHLGLPILGGGPSVMYLPQDFLDSSYDYDFTSINDGITSFSRGGEKYTRPCGWLRFALKVSGKYGPDTWLGSSNGPGEWPVSYHGTSKHNALSIAEEGFKLTKGTRFAYGRGIYSSPDHSIAEQYATRFSSQGKTYKVIFQNRVNPVNLTKVSDVNYWISPADADIRPYGMCIKEI